jgi:hypothetical protein
MAAEPEDLGETEAEVEALQRLGAEVATFPKLTLASANMRSTAVMIGTD